MAKLRTPPEWLKNAIGNAVVASGVGYVAAAYTVSRWLTRRRPGSPAKTPSDIDAAWEPLECRTSDGLRLTGWEVHPAGPVRGRGTVAIFHGLSANRAGMLDRVAVFAAAGYRCVAFDHRAHGKSEGKRTSFGYHEARDVHAILDLIRARWPDEPVAAFGISMGGAALCYAAARTRMCDAVILESVYHDLAAAFESRLRHQYPPWYRRLSRAIVWVTERRLGLRLPQLSPWRHVPELAPAPVLFVTGGADRHAPPSDVGKLYDRCRGPRDLFVVAGADHHDVWERGGVLYQRRVLEFLRRWMGR